MTLNEIKALLKESETTGRPIQVLEGAEGNWRNIDPNDDCDWWTNHDYRIAPLEQPKPREWWIDNDGRVVAVGTGMDAYHFASGNIRVREIMEEPK